MKFGKITRVEARNNFDVNLKKNYHIVPLLKMNVEY